MKKIAEAATTCKQQIIDFNDNAIDANYKSLFNGTNETSKEIIFATQYQQDFLINGILLHVGPAITSGYHFCNPLDAGANRDARLKYTTFNNLQTITVDPYSRWNVTTKVFRVGTDDKWTIAQREQVINTNRKKLQWI